MEQERPSGSNSENQVTDAEHREGVTKPVPRIYVASLSDYNAGRLHGAWLDADADEEEIKDGIATMLAASPEPGAEEWAIHDYDGFGPFAVSEFESIATVSRIARGIAEHGLAFAHWASIVGSAEPDGLDESGDAYQGHFANLADYGDSIVEMFGWRLEVEEAVPELLEPYVRIDVEAFARDMELGGDITTSPAESGGIYVFDRTYR